ncbi:hypothetical protein MLD38_034204 [Melastoma candidum]|uniref:Uncharacterized protein n=1 Tax=Melastoma candidum TaxID=119954 RepID=A0ACB9M8U8_9MYRT|nr:hypothetical protein MLD38_034204 [Melastoma candidum]
MRRPSCFALWLLSMVGLSLGGNHTMDSSSDLRDGDTLVSAEGRFKLGFFSAENSESRFLGIWYSTAPDTVVWVANRENPLNDSSGVLEFGDDGNVVLLDWSRTVFWSSNMSRTLRYPSLQILDSGNLVLGESSSLGSGDYSWQSFDYPSDTILAGLRVGWDLRAGFERFLTSWKSVDDPTPGEYTYRYDLKGLPQAVIEKGSVRKYRSGPWNGVC